MRVHYSILIQWSEEDQSFVASLPEFGPYALTHGSTYEEALKNAMEALALLIEETSPLPSPQTFHIHNRGGFNKPYQARQLAEMAEKYGRDQDVSDLGFLERGGRWLYCRRARFTGVQCLRRYGC